MHVFLIPVRMLLTVLFCLPLCLFFVTSNTHALEIEAKGGYSKPKQVYEESGPVPDYIQFPMVFYILANVGKSTDADHYTMLCSRIALHEDFAITVDTLVGDPCPDVKKYDGLVQYNKNRISGEDWQYSSYKQYIDTNGGTWRAAILAIFDVVFTVQWVEDPCLFTMGQEIQPLREQEVKVADDTLQFIAPPPIHSLHSLTRYELDAYMQGGGIIQSRFHSLHSDFIATRYMPSWFTENWRDIEKADEQVQFPVVAYLVNHNEDMNLRNQYEGVATLQETNSKTVSARVSFYNSPQYLGYLVMQADNSIQFVDKTGHNKNLETCAKEINEDATPICVEPRYFFGPRKEVPRKSWLGNVISLYDFMNALQADAIISYGQEPDPNFVPDFAEAAQVMSIEQTHSQGKTPTGIMSSDESINQISSRTDGISRTPVKLKSVPQGMEYVPLGQEPKLWRDEVAP